MISIAGTHDMAWNDSQHQMSNILTELVSVNPEPHVRSDNPSNMSDLLEETERERIAKSKVTEQPLHDSGGKLIMNVPLPRTSKEPVIAEAA